jgi:hypothetical protein
VVLSRSKYSDDDNTRTWIPMVRYELIMPHLSQDEYTDIFLQLESLTCFLKEWFIPFEAECTIAIQWHNAPVNTPTGRLLDYNTRLA